MQTMTNPVSTESIMEILGVKFNWSMFFMSLLCTSIVAFLVAAFVLLQFQRRTFYLVHQMTEICAGVTKIMSDITVVLLEMRQANLDMGRLILEVHARQLATIAYASMSGDEVTAGDGDDGMASRQAQGDR
ncbi:uncharacterized protein LOC142344935 [Convolutriloba macropyga]|uniref:uncharacterized protein LOC142344935 n=1 Tax=Convolutriloba macropyga TaxID=536237 RepID=UPI003F5280F1